MNRKQLILVIIAIVVALLFIIASFFLRNASAEEDDTTKVVATIYPIAYMAEAIGGERVTVTCLIPYNTEVHSFSPSARHMISTDSADIILYNGGPGDHWLISDVLPVIDTEGVLVVNTTIGVEYILGGHGHEHAGEEDEGSEVDPHTWLSPRQAQVQARNVFEALCTADPNGTAYFEARFGALNDRLTELDAGYQLLSTGNQTTIIVSHAAFGYIANDYGFSQEGAIGLSGDQQPSLSAIVALVDQMIEENIYTVYTDPVSQRDYTAVLKYDVERRSGHQVNMMGLYLMTGPVDGMDYLDQMVQNLINLTIGLEVEPGY